LRLLRRARKARTRSRVLWRLQASDTRGPPDLDQIMIIHDDVELEMAKYGQVLANEAPKADALYKVVVNITGGGAKLIDGVRVYYTNHGLYRQPRAKRAMRSELRVPACLNSCAFRTI
jgi:hypothetical protein